MEYDGSHLSCLIFTKIKWVVFVIPCSKMRTGSLKYTSLYNFQITEVGWDLDLNNAKALIILLLNEIYCYNTIQWCKIHNLNSPRFFYN